jgi:hypothetical protein
VKNNYLGVKSMNTARNNLTNIAIQYGDSPKVGLPEFLDKKPKKPKRKKIYLDLYRLSVVFTIIVSAWNYFFWWAIGQWFGG